ncbi:MAG: DNA repair protein RecO [Eubacteriales bacterium]|nr:DNA repair protein RecO [Eubacteriales bacterium]
MTSDLEVKGIVISAAPQGEYGRRISLLTDKLGRITAFAGGAAKAKSKIIGAVRPMTCAKFSLAKGKDAYNLHSVDVIDSFDELAFDFELSVYAMYVLEAGEYFSLDGMPEDEAKQLLNLMFVTLKALRDRVLSPELVRIIYELRLLVLQGEYTLMPAFSDNEATVELWQKCISSSLTSLYKRENFEGRDYAEFMDNARLLYKKQVSHKFKTLKVLEGL